LRSKQEAPCACAVRTGIAYGRGGTCSWLLGAGRGGCGGGLSPVDLTTYRLRLGSAASVATRKSGGASRPPNWKPAPATRNGIQPAASRCASNKLRLWGFGTRRGRCPSAIRVWLLSRSRGRRRGNAAQDAARGSRQMGRFCRKISAAGGGTALPQLAVGFSGALAGQRRARRSSPGNKTFSGRHRGGGEGGLTGSTKTGGR
jgi:hypothetical protein